MEKDKGKVYSDIDKKEETSDKENKENLEEEEKSKLDSNDKEKGKKFYKLDAKEVEGLRVKASEYDKLWDKHLRVCADFDNARKRWDREKQELIKFANVSLIKNLLTITDELEHALRAIKEDSQCRKIVEGVELTYNNLRNVLGREGLKVIDAKGKKFDPHIHEIVGQVENNDVEEHTVVEEIQKGYLLGDSLLRTSKVVISVPKAHSGESGGNKEDKEDTAGDIAESREEEKKDREKNGDKKEDKKE